MNPHNIKRITIGYNESFNLEKYTNTKYETCKPLCTIDYTPEEGEIKSEEDLDNLTTKLREFAWEQTMALFVQRLQFEKDKTKDKDK